SSIALLPRISYRPVRETSIFSRFGRSTCLLCSVDPVEKRFDKLRVAPQVLLPQIALTARRQLSQRAPQPAEPLLVLGSKLYRFPLGATGGRCGRVVRRRGNVHAIFRDEAGQ